MTESDADAELVEDYPHGKIVREPNSTGADRYHFEVPLEGRMKSFENPGKARLYADVYAAMGGFREEKTGERGVPPSVARAREDVLMAYLVAQPTMGTTWVARHYDLPEEQIREYVRGVRERAEQQREEGTDE
jgi:hypothetical protein